MKNNKSYSEQTATALQIRRAYVLYFGDKRPLNPKATYRELAREIITEMGSEKKGIEFIQAQSNDANA